MIVSTNVNTLGLIVELADPANPVIIQDKSYFPLNQLMNVELTSVNFNDVELNTIDYSYLVSIKKPNGDVFINNSTLTELGTYLATVEINYLGVDYDVIIPLECVTPIVIENTECDKVLITNYNEYIASITIYDAFTKGIIANPQAVSPGVSIEFTLDYISFYIVGSASNGVEEFYLINNYCGLNSCIAKYITDALCDDGVICEECPAPIDLNRVMTLDYILKAKINELYGSNNFYSSLNNVPTLDDVENVLTKLKDYCDRINCIGSTSSNVTKKSGCGCS